MKMKYGLKVLAGLMLVAACSKESPELIPCMCDGSESTLGLFDCMCEPMKKKPVKRFSYIQDTGPRYQTLILDEEQHDAFLSLHKNRDSFAPVKLEYVDFRIRKNAEYENYNTKLGNYKFRIFGCRRESKNVFLNQGRAMQKDMKFFDVFFETMNEYYPVVVDKSNPYYLDSDKIENPEYIITAEITDYFMNICDEFDWKNVKQKKLRSGTSEMTVVWRVMSVDKSEVYCKGMTTGYGQISEGEPRGETLLVERAFEDALLKLPEVGCFNRVLAQRVSADSIKKQKAELLGEEVENKTFAGQYDNVIKGVNSLQRCVAEKVEIPSKDSIKALEVNKKMVLDEKSGLSSVGMHGKLNMSGNSKAETAFLPVADVETVNVVETSLEPVGEIDTIDVVETALEPIGKLAKVGVVETVLEPVGDLVAIEEKSGSSGDGKVIVLDESSGINTSGNMTLIEESFGIDGTGSVIAINDSCSVVAVDEQSRTIVTNITENMNDNVKIVEDYWVDVPLDTDDQALVDGKNMLESSFAGISNKFCIKNQIPYENMNPQNLYKVRASVVSVRNAEGRKGSGLIIADNLILTSADLMVKNNNNFDIKTINGKEMKAAALRVNPAKNVALLLLDTPTKYTPLPLSLQLPEVNKDILMTLGLLDLEDEGEGYLDNEGKVIGYRWTDNGDAEIIVDTFVQTVTLGGALIDNHGNIVGMAHKTKKSDETPDLFIPVETALRSLGLEICGREFGTRKPVGFKTYETPLADAIDASKNKAPKPMKEGKK